MLEARDVLAEDQRQAAALVKRAGIERTRELLRRSQAELQRRLVEAVTVGPGPDSYTAIQLRAALAQVREVTGYVAGGLKKIVLDAGAMAAEQGGGAVVRYMRTVGKQAEHMGHAPLQLEEAMIVDAAASGVNASILRRLASSGEPIEGADEKPHRAKQGILQRYGMETIQHFEAILQQGFAAKTPWPDVRKRLTEASPFLQGAPAHWAERIVRTETHGALNRAHWEAIRETDEQLGNMVKILCATFDDRTAADSYAVHGQIRRPDEAFESWWGLYQHPPNRPNDREVVVPHRISWPIPEHLQWRTNEQVAARWRWEGRKGHPPPRPKMTTIDLGEFGKPLKKPEQPNLDHGEPEIPERAKRAPQAPVEEAKWHDPGIPEIPERLPRAPQAPVEEAEFEKPPVPEPEPENVLTASDILATKDAGAKGSNEGGFYTGTDGVQRYVKFYGDASQAHCEHLSNQIYRDLGLGAPESLTFEKDGKHVYASAVVKDLQTVQQVGLTEGDAKKVMKGFAADVLLGNWDAVGTGLDNVGVVGNSVMRVDNGGSLLFRAKAGRKPPELLNQITEWDKFLSSSNPYYSQVANKAGISKASDLGKDLVDQIERIKKLRKTEGGWAAYVEKHAAGMPAEDKKRVVEMLEARTKLLGAKVAVVKEEAKQAKAAAKQAKEDAKKAKAAAKEYAALAKKLGGAPPQKFETMPRNDAAAQAHFRALNDFGLGPGYRQMAEDALRPAQDHHSGPIAFTGSDYSDIREHERDPNANVSTRIKEHAKRIAKFFEAAKPAPPGRVFRGIHGLSEATLAKFLEEPLFSFNATTSVSREGDVAKRFANGANDKGSVLFVLEHKTAVPVETISQHRTELELLMKKGSTFRVTKRYRHGEGVIIEAVELAGSDLAKVSSAK